LRIDVAAAEGFHLVSEDYEMTRLKSVTLAMALYAVGFAVGVVLWVIAAMNLAAAGFWPSAAMIYGSFLVIAVWIVVGITACVRSRKCAPGARCNLAVFLAGTVTLSLVGGTAFLVDAVV
jgi:hypothetical protein